MDRKLLADRDSLNKKITLHRQEIVVTMIAVFPISWIIAVTGQYTPFGVIVWLQCLRMIKIRPVIKFWRWAKTYELNLFSLFEAVFYYYVAVHWLSCVQIAIAIFKKDHRNSWLARVP